MSVNQIRMSSWPTSSPEDFRRRRTANYNSIRADADAMSDARMNTKGLDRGGLSRGLGQQYAGSISAARAYGDQLAAGEQALLSDDASEANRELQMQSARERQGLTLAQLQQQQSQQQWQNQFQQYKNATDFTGSLFGGLLNKSSGGGGFNLNSILSGLL